MDKLDLANAALRWIFINGLKHSTERPEFVAKALDEAWNTEPARTPAKHEAK